MMKKLLCTLLFAIFAIGSINAQYGDISGGPTLQPIPTTSSSPGTNPFLTTNGTDFGTTPVGVAVSQSYTFTATGPSSYLVNTPTPLTGDFAVTSPTPGIDTSTFSVTFNPNTTGPQTTNVHLEVTDIATFIVENYYFQIQGTGGAATPNLVVSGDDSLQIPYLQLGSPGNNSWYGQAVANLDTVTRSFTLENTGGADLTISSIGLPTLPSTTHYNLILPPGTTFPLTIPSGFSFSYDIEFSPTVALSPLSAFVRIVSDDPTRPNFIYQVSGEGIAATPDMDVLGDGVLITSDDSNIPNTGNHTQFQDTDISTVGGSTRTFTIENNGTADLNLTSLVPIVDITGTDAADFTVTTNPSPTTITPGNSTTFVVTFDPTTVGTKDATIVIDNNSAENPYEFDVRGEATDIANDSPLLITQYYEGSDITNADNWIEVTNISNRAVTAGEFYLCLFKDTNATLLDGNLETSNPQEFILIEAMAAGDVRLYSRTGAALPLAGNRSTAVIPEPTEVCSFNGNDLILISTSNTSNAYNDRIDIMGVVRDTGTPPFWGQDKAFIKGCGTTELPTKDFASATGGGGGLLVTDYLELTLAEVNSAGSQTNIALGTQEIGTTTWTTSWDKGVPDKTRVVVVSDNYDGSTNGSIAACDLTVTGAGDIDMDGGTTNYVEVNRSFTNTGTVTIGDQESFYSVNTLDPDNIGSTDVIISGNITKIETTTLMNDIGDYTFWSSPVENANMSTVFASGVYNQGRLYFWNQAADNLIANGGSETKGEWIAAAGQTMKSGKGYISQGPIAGTYPGTANVSFTGIPKSGSVSLAGDGNPLGVDSPPNTTFIDVVFNDNGNAYDDLNLIGNPYPSAIDADEFIIDSDNSTSLNGTIWFWTHGTANNGSATGEQYTHDDYVIYNLSGATSPLPGTETTNGIIGSGQGFMVQANSDTEKITFTDKMRLKDQNNQFYRGVDTKSATVGEKDRIWLNLESSEGGAFSQILVGFFENATDGFDRAYDGIKLNEGWANLYSKIDTLNYGIQGLSSFSTDKIVPLAFSTYIDDATVTYTINIDRFEGALKDNDIYLVDNELNLTHDLKQGDYTFSVSSSVDASKGYFSDDRFTLQFTKSTLGVDDIDLNNDFVVVNEEDALLVKSKTIVSELKMYDITGRLLVNMLPNESEFRINTHNIRKGTVLILNTTFENGTELSKKAIKY